MRSRLPTIIAIAALFGLLVLALTYMVTAWQHFSGQISIHG